MLDSALLGESRPTETFFSIRSHCQHSRWPAGPGLAAAGMPEGVPAAADVAGGRAAERGMNDNDSNANVNSDGTNLDHSTSSTRLRMRSQFTVRVTSPAITNQVAEVQFSPCLFSALAQTECWPCADRDRRTTSCRLQPRTRMMTKSTTYI